MDPHEAAEMIARAVAGRVGTWADLGAGEGTFTLALARLLGPGSRVFAIDRDARAIRALERAATKDAANVVPVVADFTRAFAWPGLGDEVLDGMLFANSLHYVRDPAALLARLVARLAPGGRVVLVEYDRRGPNPWVPHPIPATRVAALMAAAGLSEPIITARRPSAFGGDLYAAMADRL